MKDRKQISTRSRFEIFKRDNFTCQYCGSTPPNVILHVDHIHPISKGGDDSKDNLITSCNSCNLGKSNILLSSVPQPIGDRMEEIKEGELQIKAYQKLFASKKKRITKEVWSIVNALFNTPETVRKDHFRSIQNFHSKMGFYECLECAEIASTRSFSDHRKFLYFCAVCWNKIREKGGEGANATS